MNPTALALAGFIAWYLALLICLVSIRSYATLVKKKPANSFSPTGDDVSPFSARLCRAHANCYESFPFVGGPLMLALATNQTATTNSLALVLLGCRIAQSSIHLASTSELAVMARFAFFLAQIGIAVCWIAQLVQKF